MTKLPPLISLSRNTLHGQSKGCWLAVHVGFTMILFRSLWGKKKGQGLRVNLGSPSHDPETGWHCTQWGVNRLNFNVPKRLQLGQYT